MATGDESVVLTSLTDGRRTDPNASPVWEAVVTWGYDSDDAGAEALAISELNGILLKVVLVLPATTTTGTTWQMLIKDNGDHTVFDSGEVAENGTHTFNLFEPLCGDIDVSIEPSAAAGTSGSIPIATLRGI